MCNTSKTEEAIASPQDEHREFEHHHELHRLVMILTSIIQNSGKLLRGSGFPDDVIDYFLEASKGPTVVHNKDEFIEVTQTLKFFPQRTAPPVEMVS